jgi:hypothetical protein
LDVLESFLLGIAPRGAALSHQRWTECVPALAVRLNDDPEAVGLHLSRLLSVCHIPVRTGLPAQDAGGVYNLSMAAYEFASKEFDDAVRAAGRRAFEETLAAGLSVFYLDDEGLDVMEQPDGRRFEIRWIPGAPSGENFEILREIKKRAA